MQAHFSLDVLLEREDTNRTFSSALIESSLQFCEVPSSPRSLNQPQYLHPLAGNQMQSLLKLRLGDFLNGDSIDFKIEGANEQRTMVQMYVEFPKDVKL